MYKRKLRYKPRPAKRLCVEKKNGFLSFLFHSALFGALSLWFYFLIQMVITSIHLKQLRDANIPY